MCQSCPCELVDPLAIAELRLNVGAAGVDDLLRSFFREARERLAALRALTVDRAESIRLQLHTLHGAAGMFGFTRLSALVRKLHAESDALSPDAYRLSLDEIARTLAASCQAFAELKSRPPSS